MNKLNFLRICALSPIVSIGDVKKNADIIIENIKKVDADIILFPELTLTGVTLEDMYIYGDTVKNCENQIKIIIDETKNFNKIIVLGTPITYDNLLLNCNCCIYKGKLLGIVVNNHIKNINSRYFSKFNDYKEITYANQKTIISDNIIFKNDEFTFSVLNYLNKNYETDIILVPDSQASSPFKTSETDMVFKSKSLENNCSIIYCNSTFSESSTYNIYDGYCSIYECGKKLTSSKKFKFSDTYAIYDIDLSIIKFKKIKSMTNNIANDNIITFDFNTKDKNNIIRDIDLNPFIIDDEEYFNDIVSMQVNSLARRLMHIATDKVVIGLSGGLDSTMALLIAYKTFKKINKTPKNIHTISMPGFGTSKTTKSNSDKLSEKLNTTHKIIDIKECVKKHFEDINYDISKYDVTYENSQARERTQILMDYANSINGIVLGTGDLSELALGFCTYNGDHMSMYNINSGIPKTLMRKLVEYISKSISEEVYDICLSVIHTPVSPELLPNDTNKIKQETEKILGSYQLHDFFIYNVLEYGYSNYKNLEMAKRAFKDIYSIEYIEKTFNTFKSRFFSQQFKRNCSADGISIFEFSLSPHKGLHMPSDLKNML